MKINMFVGDTPIEDLTEEQLSAYKAKVTDIVAEFVTKKVQRMAEEGKSEQEIKKFLRLKN